MINKISNWVFGSFFRTIGRLLCFILLGFLIATILSKEDIKWTDLLGIETIDALSLDGTPTVAHHTLFSQEEQIEAIIWRNGANNLTTVKTFYDYTNNFDYTRYMVIPIRGFAQRLEQSNQSGTWLTDVELTMVIISFEIIEKNSGYVYQCELQGNLMVCPLLPHQTYNEFRIKAWLPDSQAQTFLSINEIQLMIGPTANIYTSNDTNIIINQNDNTQDIINNQNQNQNSTMNFFNNENTTQAESSANNFFSGFTSQDNGGISSIITAPLQAISGLVSAQCIQIELPIPYLDNKTLILPCMSSIYREHFGSLFTLYQTVIFGAIAYRMLVSLFMMIQGFKNPDDDKIEVVDL